MKNLVLSIFLVMSSISAFSSERFPVTEVKILDDGVRVSIEYSKYSNSGPSALFFYGTWEKKLECNLIEGELIASLQITRTQHGPNQAEYVKHGSKNFKVKTQGLCDGQSPDVLKINGKQIF